MKILQIAVALDQLVNTIFGGYADETMSSRCWRLREYQPYKVLRPAIDAVLFFDPRHCETSYLNEIARKYQPADLPKTLE
jgi:hypothetical protein